jgi:hypothetical protein
MKGRRRKRHCSRKKLSGFASSIRPASRTRKNYSIRRSKTLRLLWSNLIDAANRIKLKSKRSPESTSE